MTAESNSRPAPLKLWKRALLLVGSAALGGLAVALWNRRELTQMQGERSRPPEMPPTDTSVEEEIY